MVNGVSEFTTTGNVNQLILAFNKDKNIENQKEIHSLLNSLQDFTQTVSLCDLSRLDSVLDNLEDTQIYRTDLDGSIMFKIKNDKLKVETCTL